MYIKNDNKTDSRSSQRVEPHVHIVHHVSGRIRFRVARLYQNAAMQRSLQAKLRVVQGILRVRINIRTGSVLVHYEPGILVPGSLLSLFSAVDTPVVSAPASAARACSREHLQASSKRQMTGKVQLVNHLASGFRGSLQGCAVLSQALLAIMNSPATPRLAAVAPPLPEAITEGSRPPARTRPEIECVSCEPVQGEGIFPWLKRYGTFIPLTGMMIHQLVEEYYFKRTIPQSALSVTGIVSMLAAIPLVKEAWRETVEERRFTIHQFLAFSLLLGIVMGEALAAFEIIYILRAGMLLEEYVANRSRRAIHQMLEVSVKQAHLLVNGVETDTPIELLRSGDRVVVRTGEKIPVDGDIATGEALLDEASITGRSEAVYKGGGDRVFAGSFVSKGMITVNALKVGGETYIARIASLVEASLDQKAPLQHRADVLAARLLKLGTFSTLMTLLLTRSFSRAFSVMIVMSCPCATILAASTAVSAALHNAARKQILVKGGVYLEKIAAADVFCFDKTGTITTEEPLVSTVVSGDERGLLYWAASAELHNPHALASAVLDRARELDIAPQQHSVSEHILGKGVKATVDGSEILLGNRRMMDAENIDLTAYQQAAETLIAQGETAVFVTRNGRLLGVMGISHCLRTDARSVVERLRASGVRHIYLLSGDERPVAEGLARQLGLDGCYAELLPRDKARVLDELRERGQTLVMVGDGVNDALALAEADIGIAMGAGGSDVAIEVADIALANSDLRNLIYVRELSSATLRIAEQNYYLAVGTNLLGVVLGASGRLSPAMGGMIHIAHTLGIMLNSSRLIR